MNNSTSARKYCAQPAALMAKGQYFCRHKTPPVPQHRGQLVKESHRVCARRRKESPIIFFGDMCGEENTSRPANVRAVRLRRTVRALQSGRRPFCQKVFLFDRRNTPCAAAQGVSAMVFFQPSAQRAYRSGYFCDSSASSASQSRGGLSSVHVSGEVLSTRSYSWPLVASCTAA